MKLIPLWAQGIIMILGDFLNTESYLCCYSLFGCSGSTFINSTAISCELPDVTEEKLFYFQIPDHSLLYRINYNGVNGAISLVDSYAVDKYANFAIKYDFPLIGSVIAVFACIFVLLLCCKQRIDNKAIWNILNRSQTNNIELRDSKKLSIPNPLISSTKPPLEETFCNLSHNTDDIEGRHISLTINPLHQKKSSSENYDENYDENNDENNDEKKILI